MRNFIISTDNTADLPASFATENAIDIHTLYYTIGDTIYGAEDALPEHEFYELMRGGQMPTTMACNPETAAEIFQKQIDAGFDVLHIAFSSALSSSYNNFCIAANDVMSRNPEAKIVVIDSLAASMGEGLMVYKAVQLRKEGKSLDQVADYLMEHRQNFVHFFTVDDLNHLYRGGRVSKATALVGTLAGIKPILHVDSEGRLIPIGKVRGRKKSLLALIDKMKASMKSYQNEIDVVYVGHGDCYEDAAFVAEKVQEFSGLPVVINYMCPTIGTHSGPGTVGVFFMGESRS